MRIYRLLWWILAAPVISVGVVGATATSSVLTVVMVFAMMALSLGALSANLQSLDRDGQARGSISMSTVIRHGCVAGVAVVAFLGLAAVAGTAVLPLAVLIVGASPVVVTWARVRRLSSKPSAAITDGRNGTGTRFDDRSGSPTPTVETMAPAELCMAWRRSFVELQRTGSVETMATIADFRRQLLDELERRNPGGFEQWMASGARAPSDPARYLLAPPTTSPSDVALTDGESE